MNSYDDTADPINGACLSESNLGPPKGCILDSKATPADDSGEIEATIPARLPEKTNTDLLTESDVPPLHSISRRLASTRRRNPPA